MQRDLPELFGLVRSHAFLNLWNRKYDLQNGAISANETDVTVAFNLCESMAVPNEPRATS
jgi:hypothetical protein